MIEALEYAKIEVNGQLTSAFCLAYSDCRNIIKNHRFWDESEVSWEAMAELGRFGEGELSQHHVLDIYCKAFYFVKGVWPKVTI